jgi:hypothetical protein
MKAKWKNRMPWAIATVAVVLALVVMARWQPARGAEEGSPGMAPHFTVVMTEGHNLIVTDNKTNMLYFYTIDKEAKIGSDLKLRGQVDLKQVGKKVIKPENVRIQK